MKRREDGSMLAAIMIGFAVIGAATVSVQNSAARISFATNEIKAEREQDKIREGALTALARFKGLMSQKKLYSGPQAGKYVPALFAQNYFAYSGKTLDARDQGANPVQTSNWILANTKAAVTIKTQSSLDSEMILAEKVFKNINSYASAPGNQDYQFKILKWNRDITGFQVKSVDVELKSLSTSKPITLNARFDLQVPEAYSPKIEYRRNGTSAWKNLANGDQLAEATYDFRIYGSGVVKYAKLKNKNKVIADKIGLDSNANPNHLANNYGAIDQLVGQKDDVTLFTTAGFDEDNCSLQDKDGKAQFQAILVEVDGTEIAGPVMNVTIKSSTQVLTENDYKTMCTAASQCPWLGGASDWDSKVFTDLYKGSPLGDMSGRYTWNKSIEFDVTNKKLCLNLDGLNESAPNYFDGAKFILYTPGSCTRQFLTARSSCGCVAEDTQILLGDGKTEKRIDQIESTDLIWNPILKKAFAIRKMTQGPEKIPMLKISVADKTLRVTGNHPFPTRSGMKSAYTLNEGEEIMIEGEGWKSITKIDAIAAAEGAAPPVVWNIEVEAPADDLDAHHYVANGVVTGDLFIQKKLQNARLSAEN